MRRLARVAAVAGWALLGLLATAGLVLSAVALLATAPFARRLVASAVVGVVDDAIAGRVALRGIAVLPQGGMELLGLEVYDPDERLVLSVGRARLFVDVTALRSRTVGIAVELDAPSVLLEEEGEGGTSLARAFAPTPRAPAVVAPGAAAPPAGGGSGGGWTVHVSRLELRGGDLWWKDARGETRVEATGLDLSGRGTIGPRRARAELRVAGRLLAPLASPVAIELVAVRAGDLVRVPVLRVEAGGTAIAAIAEGDLARRRGRVAVTRLGVSRDQARALVPAAPRGADLAATGYAEADGATLTAALRVAPSGPGGPGGRGDAAVAARLDALRRAAGFDLVLDRLDPARLAATLPAGEVTLAARGAAAGTALEDLRGRLSLTVSGARLGKGELGRSEVALRVARGVVDLDRLSARAPGVTVEGSGRWSRGGALAGHAALDVADLAAAARNAAHLAGAAPPPRLAGRARLEATLAGSADAPAATGRLDAPALAIGGTGLERVHLAFRAAGPRAAPSGEVEGRIGAVRQGGVERLRQAALRGRLAAGEGFATVTAVVPGAGSDPVSLEARGRLDRGAGSLELRQLAVAYPGARWALARPASVDLRAGKVDRLELADLPQRLVLQGGLGPRGALDARLEVSRLDLARLPAGVLPDEGVRGEVSGHLAATGPAAHPVVAGRVALEEGAYRELRGISLLADGRWDGATRRIAGTLSVARAAGGALDARVELPVPLRERPAEPVSIRLKAEALPLAELLAAARVELPAAGTLGVELRVAGTAGAPAASGTATLEGGAWGDLEGLGGVVSVEAPGATARLVASGTLAGRRVVALEASAPLDLGELTARPAETLRALRRAPLHATASVLSLDLAVLAGRAGVRGDLAGIVVANAEVTGTAAAPRVRAGGALTGGVVGEWRGLGATLEGSAGEAGIAADVAVTLQGEGALRARLTLGLRPERLGERAALAAAPLRVEVEIPRLALGRAAGAALPLAGTVEGKALVTGTLRAPDARVDLAGAGVAVKGRPLGDATVAARYAAGRADADLSLRPPSGGVLRATLGVRVGLGLGAGGPALRDAPAEAAVVADGLDLAFLPALAPGTIRTAAGKVVVDLRVAGPLRRMVAKGALRVERGRLAIAELGEWSDVALDARVSEQAIEVVHLGVRRGKGSLSASGAARGQVWLDLTSAGVVRADSARLTAKLTSSGFTIARAGMEIATFDLSADATGSWTARELGVDVTVPRGTVRLPKRSPRKLQSLEGRKDIVIGRRADRTAASAAAAAAGGPAEPALAVRVHVALPGRFFVKSDDPKIDVELRADVHHLDAGKPGVATEATGSVEVVRGTVEPFGGRTFVVEHGKVQFTGGPPEAATLDVVARYTNPATTVTARVGGTVRSPDLKLEASDPKLSQADIAFLLLTGRTEAKAGTGGVGTITGEEAGKAVLGVLATQAFRNLVQNKLPLDTVAVDAGGFRAGKYVTDRIYVGYVRRWDADPTKNQNEDEVRVEYQITPRWTFESRYGNAQSGGASLIWSKDFD